MLRHPSYIATLIALWAASLLSFAVWGQVRGGVFAPRTSLGVVEIDVSDAKGGHLSTWVRFYGETGRLVKKLRLEKGVGQCELPLGQYQAHVYVEHLNAPFLIDIETVTVQTGVSAFVLVSLAEGMGKRPLDLFDRDHDLALDRVELAAGTDPEDASSVPGGERLVWDSPVMDGEAGWYSGDLHSYSSYSIGSESVKKLVRRAERAGLDFLAITDRNTLAASEDPGFHSDKVVLVPAMEWGNEELGYALVLRPGTRPEVADDSFEVQAVIDKVREQGGVFAPSHPCFPIGGWKRKAVFFNAIEVWCMGWRDIPPLRLTSLNEELRVRRNGKFVYPIAAAAASTLRSANGQAEYFWEIHLNRGMKAAAIGGSHSASPKVPLGRPLTHVYATEKSLDAIIKGIRLGRTMISRDASAPWIDFQVDAFNDGGIETRIGGVIPIRVESRFVVVIRGGKGKRAEVLLDGVPIRSMVMAQDKLHYEFLDTPERFSFYTVRVVGPPREAGFGLLEVLAMTSPIYAQEIVFVDEETGRTSWVRLESTYREDSPEILSLTDDPGIDSPSTP